MATNGISIANNPSIEVPDPFPSKKFTLVSFGYKFPPPPIADREFDIRGWSNPHCDPKLKYLNGLNELVKQFIMEYNKHELYQLIHLLKALEGGFYSFGCYGGIHRSVAAVEIISEHLVKFGFEVTKIHRELERLT